MPYCPECGVEVEEGQTYCRECGARLYDEQQVSAGEGVVETTEEGEADDMKTREEYEGEGLVSFSISYPSRGGWTPVLISTGLGLIYGFLLTFMYFVGIFFLSALGLFGIESMQDPEAVPTLSITETLVFYVGYVLLLLIAFLPLYPVAGYYVKLTEHAAKGELEPPGFDDFTDLFVYGAKSVVLIVLPLSIFSSIIYLGLSFGVESVASGLVAAVGVGIAYILNYLIWLYLAPPMLVNYSLNQDLRDAYDLEKFRGFALNTSYPLYYLGSLALGVAVSVAVLSISFISALTIIGWIFVMPALFFYGFAVMAAYWGRVYYKTMVETA